jgi:cob(I)alamin adenosyltransferase
VDEEPKTRAADEATVLLVTITNLETRLEQLQKKIVDAGNVSGAALTLIRNELAGVLRALERATAAVDQATAAAKTVVHAPPGERF